MEGGRSRWFCARRDCPEPQEYQRCETFADASAKEAGYGAEAYHHRQAPLLWIGKATGRAGCRASFPQGLEQPGGEFAPAVSKTGTNAPRLPINRKLATFCFALLRRSQSLRSRSHKTFCQPNPQSQTASHGSMESRQLPDRLKLSIRALTRPSSKQGDSTQKFLDFREGD